MRARELVSWIVGALGILGPLAAFVALVAWAFGEAPVYPFAVLFLVSLFSPALWLARRRFARPSWQDVSEADGRRPVVVLHAFAEGRTSWLRRALIGTPGFSRDRNEDRLARALEQTLSHVGPVVFTARPPEAPPHGPVALSPDPDAWARELEPRLRAARLVAIVLDGSAMNRAELELAASICGTERVILVPPPEIDDAFLARWSAVRAALPALPPIDGAVAAVRFDRDARAKVIAADAPRFAARVGALRVRELIVEPHEVSAKAAAPGISLLLTAIPIVAAIAGAIVMPVVLHVLDHRLQSDQIAPLTVILFACAVTMAVLSRGLVRLVPSGELPMVGVAAFPWLAGEGGGWLATYDGAGTRGWLEAGALGAAYSIPLLVAGCAVLAGASLIRKSPGRRVSFAWFGIAALLPFAPILAPLVGAGDEAIVIGLALIPIAAVLALSAVSASGEALRRHAPLSIGSAVCGALALAALGNVITHATWRRVVLLVEDQPYLAQHVAAEVVDVRTFDAMWPWFALAIVAMVVLLGVQYRGRANRMAGINALALIPFVVIVALATGADTRADDILSGAERALDADAIRSIGGYELDPGFALPTVGGEPSYGAIDLVADRGGVFGGGHRIASAADLAIQGGVAVPRLASYATRPGDWPRLAVDQRTDCQTVSSIVGALAASGGYGITLVFRASDGSPVGVDVAHRRIAAARDRIQLVLRVGSDRVQLMDTAGTFIEILDERGAVSPALEGRLDERREMEPSRRDLFIECEPGVSMARFGPILARARDRFPDLAFDTTGGRAY
ncbi:MAG: hypothetical protein AB7S26_41390 [Sandaracinaceae bacterium]